MAFPWVVNKQDIKTGVVTLQCAEDSLPEKLNQFDIAAKLVCAYISPHCDFDGVVKILNTYFDGVPMMVCTTAGELYADAGKLYCPTGSRWNNVVVVCFDSTLIEEVEVVSVPLGSDDLRQGRVETTLMERMEFIGKAISGLQVNMEINFRDTFAYVLFDGLSASESFFMEALYESGRFPCLFVGGSTGGTLDFQVTRLHDGKRDLENHALIAFIKTPPDIRFGIFKSQNFKPVGKSFHVFSASVELRYVSHVFDQSGRIVTFVDALCETFGCTPANLVSVLEDYSFAITVGKELFVRSISKLDVEAERIHFYCDIAPGEELLLVRRTDLVETTGKDFAQFMEGKPAHPVAGILNDCILRRINNEPELSKMGHVMEGTGIAGFSTFGEVFGLNLNQTLTAVLFFRVPPGAVFRDEFVDNFVSHYSEFKTFFLRRQVAKLDGLSQVVNYQIFDFMSQRFDNRLDTAGMEPSMARLLSGLNDLGQVLQEAMHSLKEASIRDYLTGLYNRRYINEVIDKELIRASRYDNELSVLMMDIDYFKAVNDTFGHNGGDMVLRLVSETAVNIKRDTDVVGRYGGEEFVVVLPQTKLLDAASFAERLRESIGTLEIQMGEQKFKVTVSIGVASTGLFEQQITTEKLIECADQALYTAKNSGRNRVVLAAAAKPVSQ